MERYSTEPRTRKYVKGYGFLSFVRNLSKKHKKIIKQFSCIKICDKKKVRSK